MQKLDIQESFGRCGLPFMSLWSDGTVVWLGGRAVCRGPCLTPEGLDAARCLLPGHTESIRQMHEAAAWLVSAAAERRRLLAAAVEVARAEIFATLRPEDGRLPPLVVELLGRFPSLPPGEPRMAAVLTLGTHMSDSHQPVEEWAGTPWVRRLIAAVV